MKINVTSNLAEKGVLKQCRRVNLQLSSIPGNSPLQLGRTSVTCHGVCGFGGRSVATYRRPFGADGHKYGVESMKARLFMEAIEFPRVETHPSTRIGKDI